MNRPVRKNQDLHGNAPDSYPVALLLVDMLNDVDFPGNSQLLKSMRARKKHIHAEKTMQRLTRPSDGQPANPRSIRLHCVEAETFRFLCHTSRYTDFGVVSENRANTR
jgi:hypothetical protein